MIAAGTKEFEVDRNAGDVTAVHRWAAFYRSIFGDHPEPVPSDTPDEAPPEAERAPAPHDRDAAATLGDRQTAGIVRPTKLLPPPAAVAPDATEALARALRAFIPLQGTLEGAPALMVPLAAGGAELDSITLSLDFGALAFGLALPTSIERMLVSLVGLGDDDTPAGRLFGLELALDPVLAALEAASGHEVVLQHAPLPVGPRLALHLQIGEARGTAVIVVEPRHLAGAAALREALPGLVPPQVPVVPLRVAFRLGMMTAPVSALRLGALVLPAADALTHTEGRLLVSGRAWGRVALREKAAQITEIQPMPDEPAAAPPTAPLRAMADLPLRLSFEIGARRATLEEVAGWSPGVVLPLDAPAEDCPVEIRAGGEMGGETVARGRLVAVGDRVGVEVTEVRRPPEPPRPVPGSAPEDG